MSELLPCRHCEITGADTKDCPVQDGSIAADYRTPAPKVDMGPCGLSEEESGAVKNLTEHQGQCDEDGVTVEVSREALDVTLALVRRLLSSTPPTPTDPCKHPQDKAIAVEGRGWVCGVCNFHLMGD